MIERRVVAEGATGKVGPGGPLVGEPCGEGSTMGCEDAVHELYHYLDGELTPERRREIAEHLDLCGSCAGAAGFEAELRSVIANHCRDRVPESLISRVAEAINEEQRRHDRELG